MRVAIVIIVTGVVFSVCYTYWLYATEGFDCPSYDEAMRTKEPFDQD